MEYKGLYGHQPLGQSAPGCKAARFECRISVGFMGIIDLGIMGCRGGQLF